MLCLGDQISGREGSIRRSVGNDEDFTGTSDHINGHDSIDHFFCCGDIGISGTDDFINLGNGFGSVGQGRNGLCTADFKNTGHPA